ncbi:Retinoblastoma-binding protein, partial [Linderina pennispora]
LEEGGNALVTSDGTLVVAQANEAAWNEAQKQSSKLFSTESAIDPSQVPGDLKCPICSQLLRDAVKVPCCDTVYCSECIEQSLLEPGEKHFTCPSCKAPGVVPDQLTSADAVRTKVDNTYAG